MERSKEKRNEDEMPKSENKDFSELMDLWLEGSISDQQTSVLKNKLSSKKGRQEALKTLNMESVLTETLRVHGEKLKKEPVLSKESLGQEAGPISSGRLAVHKSNSGRHPMVHVSRWSILVPVAACLMIAVMLGVYKDFFSLKSVSHEKTLAFIKNMNGDKALKLKRDGVRLKMFKGMRIKNGDEMIIPKEAELVLDYMDGSRIHVLNDSQFRINDVSKVETDTRQQPLFSLDSGDILVEVAPRPKDRPSLFLTPTMKVKVMGTRFRLKTDTENSSILMRSGKVLVTPSRSITGRTVWVEKGFMATIGKTNKINKKALPDDQLMIRGSFKSFNSDSGVLEVFHKNTVDKVLKFYLPRVHMEDQLVYGGSLFEKVQKLTLHEKLELKVQGKSLIEVSKIGE